MLKFKDFLKEGLLLEYLTDEQRSKYSKIKMTDKARTDTNHFFGVGNDRVKEDLKDYDHDKSEIHKQIEKHIGKEIHSDEYVKGQTTDKYGRPAKIGKLIKDEKLRNQFANDNTRAGSKTNTKHYVTVVRGTEVAGQTNSAPNKQHPKGHSWGEQSCKNVDTGSNRHYLEPEIKHGTVLVRVHDHNDQEIYRATLHPHHNNRDHTAYALDSEYGVKHPAFTAHAHNVAKRLSGEHKGGSFVYKINKDVYNDSENENIHHPNVTHDHISKALDDEDWQVRHAAINRPNATTEHISKALDDEDYHVRLAAINHPNVTHDHISKALDDEDWEVRRSAVSNPNAKPEHISKALKDNEATVRFNAINHTNATHEHINKALNDEDWQVRRAAVSNPNAKPEHISKALDDEDNEVRRRAARHPNATPDHISKALDDEDNEVREAARKNTSKLAKVTRNIISKPKQKEVKRAGKSEIIFH
jgi:HEAT repeat protein